jgi:parallel beta-helix repeat protein
MPKKEKKKKKSWKERQRERQIRQQRAREAYRIQKEREAERKPRKWPKGKILGAICLLVLIFGAYGAWQYTKPSAILEEPPPLTPTGGAIYIRADGLVDPSTASILNVGNIYYTFTADIHDLIVIERDNIVVDGANYTLQGTGGSDSKGIDLTGRTNVTITNIKIKAFDYGVYLYSASHSVLSQNDLTNNNYGIYLEYSSNNTVNGNGITNNQCGIELYESSNNRNYHNNFIDNAEQAYSYASTNVWDDGYPSGGNYWSDYEERYPDADELGGSGIWDTPYVIDENNQDNYPLMNL